MRTLLFLTCCLLTADLLAAGNEIEGERAAATTICPTPYSAETGIAPTVVSTCEARRFGVMAVTAEKRSTV